MAPTATTLRCCSSAKPTTRITRRRRRRGCHGGSILVSSSSTSCCCRHPLLSSVRLWRRILLFLLFQQQRLVLLSSHGFSIAADGGSSSTSSTIRSRYLLYPRRRHCSVPTTRAAVEEDETVDRRRRGIPSPPASLVRREPPAWSTLRTYTLVDAGAAPDGAVLAEGWELSPRLEGRGGGDETIEEDEVEYMYPTQRRYFQWSVGPHQHVDGADAATAPAPAPTVHQVRTTSFGCGKHGHQVWPSSIALSLLLVHECDRRQCNSSHGSHNSGTCNGPENGDDDDIKPQPALQPQSVLELGAGCGLPSITCRDALRIPSVVATDFWYVDRDVYNTDADSSSSLGVSERTEQSGQRLIPEPWHGLNLRYNVERNQPQSQSSGQQRQCRAQVFRADWHDLDTVRHAASAAAAAAAPKEGGSNTTTATTKNALDWVIGSDLVYYGTDVQPLWDTIEVLLYEYGAQRVLLVSPIDEARDALPRFVRLLESKTNRRGDDDDAATDRRGLDLDRRELHLYRGSTDESGRPRPRGDPDRFVQLTLTPKRRR